MPIGRGPEANRERESVFAAGPGWGQTPRFARQIPAEADARESRQCIAAVWTSPRGRAVPAELPWDLARKCAGIRTPFPRERNRAPAANPWVSHREPDTS